MSTISSPELSFVGIGEKLLEGILVDAHVGNVVGTGVVADSNDEGTSCKDESGDLHDFDFSESN
eukprot:CAMPEP_0178475006 /NCGR_PEP_ID=MMETSP0696-20121128/2891_1 /TAXON_ID=265572 /ORGANISM="Extubocellulus spinifer, Strain CCMP396" /LENGTH=63 /DNA_ID=CAMNT_0020102269 /DNA_START=101 /DNA_END=292 /DNA_ORIENTATION=-